MYNGVGLPTPRGTGTSGYVQKNAGYLEPSKIRRLVEFEKTPDTKPDKPKELNEEIVIHNKKREIEIEILKLEDELTEKGYFLN